ncbi:hypothetical protein ACP275_02G104700 [Erythranthe tilingii]
MFDGVSSTSTDQFHQFMAARRTSSSSSLIANYPLSSFTNLHHHHHHQENPSSNFSVGFDNTYSSSTSSLVLHHHHQQQESSPNNNTKEDIDVDVKHVVIGSIDPWSDEEVLALLRLRSTMEIWFPDFTWLHISRKLSELGFKRSAEQCKDRFDQETKHLNTSATLNYSKNNYKNILMSELDEFYPPADQEQAPVSPPKQIDQKLFYKNINAELQSEANLAANPSQENGDAVILTTTKKPINKRRRKKEKRKDKFEIFKGFCQAVVNKMMAQQEDLHNKLIDDIVKRDEENIAKDEARKHDELERLKREMDVMAKEQAIARERQATLIEFLKKFTSQDDEENTVNNEAFNSFVTSSVLCHDKETAAATSSTSPTTTAILAELPKQIYKTASPTNIVHGGRGGGDLGKRWPRDEVLALINLRCKLSSSSSNSNEDEHAEMMSAAKGIPLWERISQGMMELGYKRNAKRCKEKWENINKYFRKTKDSNKKRSINSRTCPYFQQLTSLYSQAGTVLLVGPPTNNIINNVPEN